MLTLMSTIEPVDGSTHNLLYGILKCFQYRLSVLEPFGFGFDNGVTYLKFTVSLLSCRQIDLTNINVDVKS